VEQAAFLMADNPEETAHLKPQMPQIPGVADQPAAEAAETPTSSAKPQGDLGRIFGMAAAALVVSLVAAWLFLHAPRASKTPASLDVAASNAAGGASGASAPVSAPPAADGSVVVATLDELAQPWSSRPFQFRKRLSGDFVDALAVRLPGNAARVSSFWGFALEEPFTKCRLEYVTDLARLSNQFGYAATHPMVVSSCNSAIYDPLKMGTLPTGAWVRGQVVSGSGLRPPTSIELRIDGNHLVATQIE
jgi:hypothetical protein